VALDTTDFGRTFDIVTSLPESEHLIIEAGTPLIKRQGIDIIRAIRGNCMQNTFIVADMKTLDTGALETQIAADAGADAIVVSGLAPIATIDNVISEAENREIYSIIDTLNVADPISMLTKLEFMPNIVELHRAIDSEDTEHQWGNISEIKTMNNEIMVAVAGGIQIDNIKEAISAGADIVVVGRAITASSESGQMAYEFLCALLDE
jgi:bifunctional enzyme Fae/Hps